MGAVKKALVSGSKYGFDGRKLRDGRERLIGRGQDIKEDAGY